MESRARTGQRIEWKDERDRIDIAAVATNLLGPAPGRRGERGRRLWWNCPFHEDGNPSLCVDPGRPWWRCYGCDAKGDAATLVMKLKGMTFPEAVAHLTGNATSPGNTRPPTRPQAPPRGVDRPDLNLKGMSPEAAALLVDGATARL